MDLTSETERSEAGAADEALRLPSWVPAFVAFVALAGFLLALRASGVGEMLHWGWGEDRTIGQVVRAYGTVKQSAWLGGMKSEAPRRLETGRAILSPLSLGDEVQTGENSAAELLFHGGATLQLKAESLVRFEERKAAESADRAEAAGVAAGTRSFATPGSTAPLSAPGANGAAAEDEVSIRLLLGSAFLEFPAEGEGGDRFVFRAADGKLVPASKGQRFVLTLNALESYDDAVEVSTVADAELRHLGSEKDLELRFLAHGEEVGGRYELLVPPLEEETHRGEPPAGLRDRSLIGPTAVFPPQESSVDIEKELGLSFKWDAPAHERRGEHVVGYEVLVRPAFGYTTDDDARRSQIFALKSGDARDMRIDKVGGGGVFLWSVRAVTETGRRTPASRPRWLEIKFPKRLMAPVFKKVKIQ